MKNHTLHRSALREYDIRGIVGQTLFEEDAYAIGRSFGSILIRSGGKRIAVGRDGRLSSPAMEAQLVSGLMDAGCDVVKIGLGPTPMLYYAEVTQDVDAGIQITGSHNPAEYNGFKMVLRNASFFGADIQRLGRIAADGDWEGEWQSGRGTETTIAVEDAYVEHLLKGLHIPPYRIGWDAGNGASGRIIEALVARLPGEHFTLFTDIDGTFPNHHPDPTEEKNLAHLKALVADKKLDFGQIGRAHV